MPPKSGEIFYRGGEFYKALQAEAQSLNLNLKLSFRDLSCEQQDDGWSCGYFVAENAKYFLENGTVTNYDAIKLARDAQPILAAAAGAKPGAGAGVHTASHKDDHNHQHQHQHHQQYLLQVMAAIAVKRTTILKKAQRKLHLQI